MSGEFRGFDPEGHRVVVGWVRDDGSEYLVALTKCCNAVVSVDEHGHTYCKGCDEYAPAHLGAEARLGDPARVVQVVWKDEGDFGFITTLTQADLSHRVANPKSLGVPYDPNRHRAYGSLEEARALASEHGAELVQS